MLGVCNLVPVPGVLHEEMTRWVNALLRGKLVESQLVDGSTFRILRFPSDITVGLSQEEQLTLFIRDDIVLQKPF